MTEHSTLKVLIVDDHPLMRGGISGEVGAEPDMTVVGEASDGAEALALFRLHHPDITLMDIRMPGINGLDALASIRQEFPHARIIVLTTFVGDVQALRAFKLGAMGYLHKDMLRSELVKTIRLVHAGHRRIPPQIALEMAEHASDEFVTARELEVLSGVAKGNSNKIIASDLYISEHTVKNHVKSILAKLSANDRTHAVTIAVKRGFLELWAFETRFGLYLNRPNTCKVDACFRPLFLEALSELLVLQEEFRNQALQAKEAGLECRAVWCRFILIEQKRAFHPSPRILAQC
jgi:DNA-binding NarL/FixJ family response regulator